MSSDEQQRTSTGMRRKRTLPEEDYHNATTSTTSIAANVGAPLASAAATALTSIQESRSAEAAKQLLCGGVAGSVAKTVTAPFSRLTILFQVHSLVTTKEHRPKFAMSIRGGISKIVERGGILSLWRGNMTSVLHRFPYSALNFYIYENALDLLSGATVQKPRPTERNETERQLVRRVSKIVLKEDLSDDDDDDDDDVDYDDGFNGEFAEDRNTVGSSTTTANRSAMIPIRRSGTPLPAARRPPRTKRDRTEDTPALHKFIAGAIAGTVACLGCYPLDLVRTRLTTELEGLEHYRGIVDAFKKIYAAEGIAGFYSGVGPTLLVAVPNFSISYTVYGTLKEYTLDDELFINFRKIDAESGETKLGFGLTILCGAASGILATMLTFPMDTIRRRMQIQNLHLPPEKRLSSRQQFVNLVHKEGLLSVYRGLTPELLKVVPMVGTMFVVYEWTKDLLNVKHDRG